jgi:hypothetical protein
MAMNDNMKEGIKILTIVGSILYASSWLAGVDYELTIKNEDIDEIIENDVENDENTYIDEANPNVVADTL